jgi:hypothetical protein
MNLPRLRAGLGAGMSESRYSRSGQAVLRTPDGRLTPYLLRRFLPQPTTIPQASLTAVAPRDRLDLIATRTLGNPLLGWRIADANAAMDPAALTVTPGRVLVVPASRP